MFHGLRSWWWEAVGAVIYVATIWAGFVLTSLGQSDPEFGIDVALSSGRDGALVALSECIHYVFGPVGATALVIVICVYLIWFRRRPVQSLAFASVIIAGWLASTAAKILVARPRPPLPSTDALITETGNNSFPSGHTAFAAAFVLAVTLVLANGKAQQVAALVGGTVFVAAVAFTRMYLGVHYLSDVIASLFTTAAAVLAWMPVWNNLLAPRLPRDLSIRVLSPPHRKRGQIEGKDTRKNNPGP
jgi:undecaprenyl-diphosphatase